MLVSWSARATPIKSQQQERVSEWVSQTNPFVFGQMNLKKQSSNELRVFCDLFRSVHVDSTSSWMQMGFSWWNKRLHLNSKQNVNKFGISLLFFSAISNFCKSSIHESTQRRCNCSTQIIFSAKKKKQKKFVWKKTAHFTETWFFSSDIQILFPVKNVDIFSVGAVGVIL